MRNMRVSAKLIVSFLIVTIFAVMLAGIGIWSSVSINSNYTYLLEEPIERQNCLKDMQLQFTMMRYRTANYAMEVNNPDIITSTLTPQYESAYAAFTASLNAYIQNNDADSRRDSATIKQNYDKAEKLRKLVDEFKQASENTRAIALSGDYDAATISLRNVIPLTTEINTQFDEMIKPAAEYVSGESVNMDGFANTLTIVQISVTVVCIILSILLALFISGLISKPLLVLTAFMDKAGSTGDIKLNQEDIETIGKYSQIKDETGRCISSTANFVKHITALAEELGTIAEGDLTTQIEVLSENDVIGVALQKMRDNLNSMFGEINASTSQVSTGSKQIADGAQSLAQGSTEQAAAVEQLSSSIAEIAAKTKSNAELAGRAASLANTIMSNAEKGNRQMDEMIAAVKEINDASHSINKVIKVIDDIAFQTNILALNAAVEAARAGQHGKGFAVVAEEVRNLAAKSAEAAKETGSLIANSMEKAELGARIAGETSASLSEIVSGINESNRLVGDIARSSEEQSLGISQINTGIDQVAQVVQQNSATAEESAAASEEMSGQSNMLEQLIAQFKLKNDGMNRGFQNLQSNAKTYAKRVAIPAKSLYTAIGENGKY